MIISWTSPSVNVSGATSDLGLGVDWFGFGQAPVLLVFTPIIYDNLNFPYVQGGTTDFPYVVADTLATYVQTDVVEFGVP